MTGRLDTCGCFPLAPPEAQRPDNVAGLDRLAYRVATHPTALARMLADLPGPADPSQLARLSTREADDPAIALLDAAALVADVLSFYSERIANEGYLRTATERRSILELARAIGYELGPGVAAEAFLAFTVEGRAVVPGAPAESLVRPGTRVQSLPADGGFPQTFETSDALLARAAWNELRPVLAEEQDLGAGVETIYLAGTASGVEEGDVLLLAIPGATGQLEGTPEARRVHRAVLEPDADRTRIELAAEAAPATPKAKPAYVAGKVVSMKQAFTGEQAELALGGSVWSEQGLGTLMAVTGWQSTMLVEYFSPKAPPPPDLPPAAPGVFAFRTRAATFGHNAPRWSQLPAGMRQGALVDNEDGGRDWEVGAYPKDWDDSDTNVTVLTDSQGAALDDATIRLDTTHQVGPDSWVLLSAGSLAAARPYRVADVAEPSLADFAISAKVTQLSLKDPDGTSPAGLDGFTPRSTSVLLGSGRLRLAPVPLPPVVEAGEDVLELDRLVLGLAVGQRVSLTGERPDLGGARGTETLTLAAITHAGGRTTLTFSPLKHPYARRTIVLNANVAAATHGETVAREVLGSGNGRPNQRFRLRRPPVTHVPAATPTGARSTLVVRVDGVRWEEAESLTELGPRDERYLVRRDDDGRTTVIFGDGTHGACPPTGTENVSAEYRTGIGRVGLVPAGALTLLAARPPGVRDVTNPLPAAGAEDPESRDEARGNAPLTVATLGRIVSLTDYEDFARAFAGIAKARATELWHGERRAVHVTLAGPDGADVPASTLDNLRKALETVRDPGVEVELEGFVPIYVRLAAEVLVDPRREAGPVTSAARAALAEAFGFDRRSFGQALTASEAIAVLMRVPGVLDTRVLALHPVVEGIGEPEVPVQDPVLARLARWAPDAGGIEPAELALLEPAGAQVAERAP